MCPFEVYTKFCVKGLKAFFLNITAAVILVLYFLKFTLILDIVRKFWFVLNCPQVLSNKYVYPTLLYSIRPQIPLYSISSANSLLFYIVRIFFFKLSASSIQLLYIQYVRKFPLKLYCP